MPSIEASLQLYDRFSNKLRSVNQAMQQTIGIANQLRGAMQSNVQINISTGGAVAKIERLKQRVDALGAHRTELQIGVNTAGAMAEVERLKQRIRSTGSSALNVIINASDVTSEIARIQTQIRSGFTAASIPISLDTAGVIAEARSLKARIRAAGNTSIDITINAPNLNAQMASIQARIGSLRAQVRLDMNTAAVRAQLETAMRRITRNGRAVRIPIELDTAGALRQATLLRAQIMARINTITARVQLQLNSGLNSGLTNLTSSMDHLRLAVEELTRTMRRGPSPPGGGSRAGSLGGIGGMLASLVAMVGGGLLIKGTIGGAMEQQQQIDLFSARTGDAGHGQAIYDAITEQALKYGADVRGSISGAQSFMSNTMNPEQLKQLNMLSMRLAKLNPYEGMEGASFSMKELMSGDYTSIVERFNMSRGLVRDSDARKAGLAGDTDAFIKGMDELLNRVNITQEALDKMLVSPAAKWTRILETFKFKFAEAGRAALAALVPIFDRITAWMDSGAFDRFFGVLSAGLAIFVQGVAWAIDMMAAGVQFITDHWQVFAGLLGFISTVLLGAMIVRLWAMIAPIVAQAAAWMITYWPITLIATAIGIAIYALYAMGFTTQEIVGTMVGLFYMLKVHFENVIIHLQNAWIVFTDFFHNLFIDPVYAVKMMFWSMADNALSLFYEMARGAEEFASSMVETIGNAINTVLDGFSSMVQGLSVIPGFENLKGFSVRVDTSSPTWLSDGVKALQNGLQSIKPTSDAEGLKHTDPIPYKTGEDYAGAFDLGYGKGAAVVDNIAGMISGVANLGTAYNPEDYANAGKMSSIPSTADSGKDKKPNVGKVDKVGKVEDSVDISSEDLKMMRELAEMKSIQNFVTLTPTVNVKTGDINSGTDVDDLIAKIGDSLNESFESNARGTYGG